MSKPTRCHECGHPGRYRRRITPRKKWCDCGCHAAPDVDTDTAESPRRHRRHRRAQTSWWEPFEVAT